MKRKKQRGTRVMTKRDLERAFLPPDFWDLSMQEQMAKIGHYEDDPILKWIRKDTGWRP